MSKGAFAVVLDGQADDGLVGFDLHRLFLF